MKLRYLVTAMLTTSVVSSGAMADESHKIVDEPLELSIQMNHKRYPVYKEDWPVEIEARKLTNNTALKVRLCH